MVCDQRASPADLAAELVDLLEELVAVEARWHRLDASCDAALAFVVLLKRRQSAQVANDREREQREADDSGDCENGCDCYVHLFPLVWKLRVTYTPVRRNLKRRAFGIAATCAVFDLGDGIPSGRYAVGMTPKEAKPGSQKLARKLRELRGAMTQAEAAAYCELNLKTWENLERANVEDPKPKTLKAIAKAFEMPYEELWSYVDDTELVDRFTDEEIQRLAAALAPLIARQLRRLPD